MRSLSLSLIALNLATPAAAQTVTARPVNANVEVLVTDLGKGVYRFSFFGDYAKPNGDLDFTAVKSPVKINFTIHQNSAAGIRFASAAEDAMWIVEKSKAGPSGEPEARYQGAQFTEFTRVNANGRKLSVLDRNDDGKTWQYALRFDLAPRADNAPAPDQQTALAFLETQKDGVYEYAAMFEGPNGAMLVMDPKIQNGTTGN
ncbi:MAG: hypothetical protein U5J99_10480 [Parvularculaceae bacterium]|nr:hypothetical protein [Parvularculaceae bacterium]